MEGLITFNKIACVCNEHDYVSHSYNSVNVTAPHSTPMRHSRPSSCPNFDETTSSTSSDVVQGFVTKVSVVTDSSMEARSSESHSAKESISPLKSAESADTSPNQAQLARESVLDMFPYAHMVAGALHIAPFVHCYSCLRHDPSAHTSFTDTPTNSAQHTSSTSISSQSPPPSIGK